MAEKRYLVQWEIDEWAETPREAAALAWDHMRNPGSTANVFTVKEYDSREDAVKVDLMEEEPRQPRALPVIRITINGVLHGEFFWDARLEQIRRTDNPHDFADVDADLYESLCGLKVGEVHRLGGGAEPLFEYERLG